MKSVLEELIRYDMTLKNKIIEKRKEGYSHIELSKMFDIPRTTISKWCNGIKISEFGKLRLEELYKLTTRNDDSIYGRSTIYGPYKRKDGREHVIIRENGKNKTVSYPKYLMECHLGRFLKDDETIHHKDGNVTNNDISNLEVINRSIHISQDVIRLIEQQFECPICKIKFKLIGSQLSDAISNRKQGKTGPFCSKSCAGKYGAFIQNGKINELDVIKIIPAYNK